MQLHENTYSTFTEYLQMAAGVNNVKGSFNIDMSYMMPSIDRNTAQTDNI
jgi:hypothetical protein